MENELTSLDQLELNLSPGNLTALNLILGFIMFGVALGIDYRDFTIIFRRPKAVLIGLSGQLIILPFLTVVLIYLLGDLVTPGMAMGMILVSSCPGGNVSNFMVHLARGNTALSVSLTAFSTVGAIITTPLNFLLWGSVYSRFILDNDTPLLRSLEIDPFEVGKTVVLLLGIPLMLGMLAARYLPAITEKIDRPIRILSVLAFVAIVVVAFQKNADAFTTHISAIFLIVLLHNLIIITGGWHWGRWWKLDRRDRRSVSIEMGIQNTGLGLVLLLNPSIFPPELPIGGMAAIAAWWGIWHIISGLALASLWRGKMPEVPTPAA